MFNAFSALNVFHSMAFELLRGFLALLAPFRFCQQVLMLVGTARAGRRSMAACSYAPGSSFISHSSSGRA